MTKSALRFYQIESSSKCSATCDFCPQPTMERAKENMSLTTFKMTIDAMPNRYVALHHFGEPFLNPQLPEMIEYANAQGKIVEFSTNGRGLHNQAGGDDYLRRVLAARPHRMRIAYDFFRPDDFIRDALTFNVSTVITTHAVTEGLLKDRKPFNNWAGQLDERPSEIHGECFYLKYQYGAVMADGRVVPCCQDYEGKHVIGSVFDPANIQEHPAQGYDLCKNCEGMQFAKDGGWWEEMQADPSNFDMENVPGELKDVPRAVPRARRKKIPIVPIK